VANRERRRFVSRERLVSDLTAQGSVYCAFIAAQEDKEFSRRDRLDGWAANAVTTSSGLLTLAVGLVAFVKADDSLAGVGSSQSLGLSIVFLLLAAAFAIFARHNYKYNVTEVSTLSEMLNEHWKDDPIDASNRCARLQIATIESLRKVNKIKSRWLISAMIGQVAGGAILGITLLARVSSYG